MVGRELLKFIRKDIDELVNTTLLNKKVFFHRSDKRRCHRKENSTLAPSSFPTGAKRSPRSTRCCEYETVSVMVRLTLPLYHGSPLPAVRMLRA